MWRKKTKYQTFFFFKAKKQSLLTSAGPVLFPKLFEPYWVTVLCLLRAETASIVMWTQLLMILFLKWPFAEQISPVSDMLKAMGGAQFLIKGGERERGKQKLSQLRSSFCECCHSAEVRSWSRQKCWLCMSCSLYPFDVMKFFPLAAFSSCFKHQRGLFIRRYRDP